MRVQKSCRARSAATPASSTQGRRGRLIAGAALLTVVLGLVAWLVPQDRDAAGLLEGHALDGGLASQVDLGNEHLHLGNEYWLNLPQVTNISGAPVTLLKAWFVSLPKGLELLGYKVVSTDDTDGFGMGVVLVGSSFDDITSLPERPNTFMVKAHHPAERYHLARLKVTGPIADDTTQCRFWYRQGSVKFRQDLRCVNQLRLAK
ncbi:hypothetical protein [Streptomyces sp. NPDC002516]